MTDERMGDALLPSITALPRRSAIIFRHYSLAPPERRALFVAVKRVARAHRHMLIAAGGLSLRADGVHGRQGVRSRGIKTVPVHNPRDIVAARRSGANLLFASPVFSTRSHVGEKPLGRVRFGLMIRNAGVPVIALGGMDARQARSLAAFGIYGWAAIDALTVARHTKL